MHICCTCVLCGQVFHRSEAWVDFIARNLVFICKSLYCYSSISSGFGVNFSRIQQTLTSWPLGRKALTHRSKASLPTPPLPSTHPPATPSSTLLDLDLRHMNTLCWTAKFLLTSFGVAEREREEWGMGLDFMHVCQVFSLCLQRKNTGTFSHVKANQNVQSKMTPWDPKKSRLDHSFVMGVWWGGGGFRGGQDKILWGTICFFREGDFSDI